MTPREFLEVIVRPNVRDFRENCGSVRHAYNAIAAVDALAAHVYVWCAVNASANVRGVHDDTEYRARLAARDGDFSLLRDIAKAQKHVRLTKNPPAVERADQVAARTIGYGEGRYGEGRYGGVEQVLVDIQPDDFRYVETVVLQALAFLEGEMALLRI
jgi:hypothetical protein